MEDGRLLDHGLGRIGQVEVKPVGIQKTGSYLVRLTSSVYFV